MLAGNDLPAWFSEGLCDSARLEAVARFQDGFNVWGLAALGESMVALYRAGKGESADRIANLILGMRLAEIADDEVACLLAVEAAFACIVGGSVPLLRSCLRAFSRRRQVREALSRLRNNVLASISCVPALRRDAVRLVLGMLRDVSGSELPTC